MCPPRCASCIRRRRGPKNELRLVCAVGSIGEGRGGCPALPAKSKTQSRGGACLRPGGRKGRTLDDGPGFPAPSAQDPGDPGDSRGARRGARPWRLRVSSSTPPLSFCCQRSGLSISSGDLRRELWCPPRSSLKREPAPNAIGSCRVSAGWIGSKSSRIGWSPWRSPGGNSEPPRRRPWQSRSVRLGHRPDGPPSRGPSTGTWNLFWQRVGRNALQELKNSLTDWAVSHYYAFPEWQLTSITSKENSVHKTLFCGVFLLVLSLPVPAQSPLAQMGDGQAISTSAPRDTALGEIALAAVGENSVVLVLDRQQVLGDEAGFADLVVVLRTFADLADLSDVRDFGLLSTHEDGVSVTFPRQQLKYDFTLRDEKEVAAGVTLIPVRTLEAWVPGNDNELTVDEALSFERHRHARVRSNSAGLFQQDPGSGSDGGCALSKSITCHDGSTASATCPDGCANCECAPAACACSSN